MEGPNTIFIIPYRNREKQMQYFKEYFKTRVKNQYGMQDAEYYFVQQDDKRPFNRGAMKNIGFLFFSKKYSNWKDITFIFHDIDYYPDAHTVFPYRTSVGNVAHYYGFKYTLGGAIAIKGSDYANTGGYPNFWGWGYEDNVLKKRVESNGIQIDRSVFYDIHDKHLICLPGETNVRFISKEDVLRHINYACDSYKEVKNISWHLNDNVLNVTSFDVMYPPPDTLYRYDLRSGELNLSSYLFKRGKSIIRNRKWGLQFNIFK